MQSLNDEFDIRLFSHLIQTVLYCRLGKKRNIDQQISHTINKLQSRGQNDKADLNFGIQTLSKLHEGSNFYVYSMIKKHFLTHELTKYCIYLEIFTLHNKKQQQEKGGKSDKNKLIQKWVFRRQNDTKRHHFRTETNKNQSDLIFKVLAFIKEQNQSQNQESGNKMEINNNTTATKGYQLIIKSHCPKKRKDLIHVLHLEKNISQLEVHTQSLKSSLLQLPNFWEKSMHFYQRNAFFVGCYFYKSFKNEKTAKIETVDSEIIRQPDRKMSSETKAEQKESTCSFKFSLENFSFRLSGNRKFKQSSDVRPIRKTSQEIANLHRPRYQSIYESKDEEMNIFILSPRKLSQDESPKIKHLEQKPIHFEITGKGISEEVIEQFILEPDEFMSNGSSEGFEMLEENDQLDSINEEKSMKLFEKEQQQMAIKQKQVLNRINDIENELIEHLRSVEKGFLLSV